MSHRAHLFSLRLCHALRESLAEGYNRHKLVKDVLAGVTVGIIAIPLAMAIASGVPPQYGLYTAIIAGFVIALTGGSRFSIIKYSQHHRRSFTLAVYGKQAEE